MFNPYELLIHFTVKVKIDYLENFILDSSKEPIPAICWFISLISFLRQERTEVCCYFASGLTLFTLVSRPFPEKGSKGCGYDGRSKDEQDCWERNICKGSGR